MLGVKLLAQVPTELNPPIQYSLIWLFIGLALTVAIITWYGFVIRSTRRRPIMGINDLALLGAKDIESLKAKYTAMIDQSYKRYQRGEISLRELHRSLSMIVREFASKVSHFPATNLTLSELKYSSYPELAQLIERFYPSEFDAIEHGDAQVSVEAAKALVRRWLS